MSAVRTERIDAVRVRIPRTGAMRAEGLLFATDPLLEKIRVDNALEQVRNVAHLPGIVGPSLAMPDVHWGYGFPIGGVAAFVMDEGVVSPGGVGYDINCGVRLLRTTLVAGDLRGREEALTKALFKAVPAGLGSRHRKKTGRRDLNAILTRGAAWAVEQGFGRGADLDHIEDRGCLPGADPGAVSERALARGAPQVGTLGSGNHFCEVEVVDEVFDRGAAAAFGLARDQVVVSLHSGSRGLGHQVCDDAIKDMLRASARYGIDLPDRQLCAAPLASPEGAQYLAAMAAAANYAFANRQVMSALLARALDRVFGSAVGLGLVYDVCHNIAKVESHRVGGSAVEVCVHRKGATRAFPEGHPAVPADYRAQGQPVLIPGDMGRYSFVLRGLPGAMEETFGSCCHGAGRAMSRHKAKKAGRGRNLAGELRDRGVVVAAAGRSTLAEEMPEAYKDVSEVVDTVQQAGLAAKVARLRPVCVVKG